MSGRIRSTSAWSAREARAINRPSGATQAMAVADGDAHTCVLVSPSDGLGGEIYCFGDNTYGELGDGTLTSRPTPALVALGTSGVRAAAVTAGGGHSCAIDVNGEAWCWGRNEPGTQGRPYNSPRKASLASTIRLDKSRSAARLGPISRGSSHEIPYSAISPRRAKAVVNRVPGPPNRTSK